MERPNETSPPTSPHPRQRSEKRSKDPGADVIAAVRKVADIARIGDDEVVGDVLLYLVTNDGLDWPLERIRACTWTRIRHYRSARFKRSLREVRDERISEFDDGDDLSSFALLLSRYSSPEVCCEAGMALSLLAKIPEQSRAALAILIDGGSPIDVAAEMGVSVPLAITLIKEARLFVHRV